MSAIKTILVPTDFSVAADAAVYYALNVAKAFNASVILYHSFIPFESGFYPQAQSKKENDEAENVLAGRLLKLKEVASEKYKALSIQTHVDRGPDGIALRAYCKKKKISLVIMGTKGAGGLKEATIGSYTSEVMAKASCPVLAIPMDYKYTKPRRIVFASNYNKKEFSALEFLTSFNDVFNAKINILHINMAIINKKKELDAFIKFKAETEKKIDSKLLSFQHIDGNDVSEELLKVASSGKVDILAVSPEKREGLFDFLFHKSVTKATAHRVQVPLLSVPI